MKEVEGDNREDRASLPLGPQHEQPPLEGGRQRDPDERLSLQLRFDPMDPAREL